jgi:exonuclease III
MRIDHILVSDAFKSSCIAAIIDKTPRKLEGSFDHTPVILEFA